MRIRKYGTVKALINDNLLRYEEPEAANLIKRFRDAKRSGKLITGDSVAYELFNDIYKWKNPRFLYKAEKDTGKVKTALKEFLNIKGNGEGVERKKIISLISPKLKGVGIAVASAIMTTNEPENYGVIDTKVWKLLYGFNIVQGNPNGRDFTIEQWLDYIYKLRGYASEYATSVRTIERTFFVFQQLSEILGHYNVVH